MCVSKGCLVFTALVRAITVLQGGLGQLINNPLAGEHGPFNVTLFFADGDKVDYVE